MPNPNPNLSALDVLLSDISSNIETTFSYPRSTLKVKALKPSCTVGVRVSVRVRVKIRVRVRVRAKAILYCYV
jgi:hypothetical protein